MSDREPIIPKPNGHFPPGQDKEGRENGKNGVTADTYGSRDSSANVDMPGEKKENDTSTGPGGSDKVRSYLSWARNKHVYCEKGTGH